MSFFTNEMDNRNEKAARLIWESAAEFLVREAGPQSLITVTSVVVSSDFSYATIYFTVLPEEKEEGALGLAHRHVEDFKYYLKTRAKLPRTPHIEFKIDKGQKNFERLQELDLG